MFIFIVNVDKPYFGLFKNYGFGEYFKQCPGIMVEGVPYDKFWWSDHEKHLASLST